MVSGNAAVPRAPGQGTFTCCTRDHVMIDEHGVRRTIPCDKDKIGNVMAQMLEKKREFYLGNGDMLMFRVWTALSNSIMQGLATQMHNTQPTSVTAFLALNHFRTPRDEENRGSGYTPLIFSAMSGYLSIVRELLGTHGADVSTRVRVDIPEFSAERGMDVLCLAVGACPQHQVHDVVAALLAAGADPNTRTQSGGSAIVGGVVFRNENGVRALLSCAGDKLDLQLGLHSNNASALGIAGYLSSFEILKSLVEAGANCAHRNDNGSHILVDICQNDSAQPFWLDFVYKAASVNVSDGRGPGMDANARTMPRTAKWKALNFLCRMLLRLGVSRSDLVLGMAHSEHATGAILRVVTVKPLTTFHVTAFHVRFVCFVFAVTALHWSAATGNINLVRWLLRNGAYESIYIKNRMGCTPLDMARIFGPHPEVSAPCSACHNARACAMLCSPQCAALQNGSSQ